MPRRTDHRAFARLLTEWFDRGHRDLPWRRTRDPYAIWVSEIMLQQTRVSAVIPYYERFLRRFPNLTALAEAPEQDLLAAWAGLGYYSRVRNLQQAARQTGGTFPRDYDGIRALAGVGDYTAAAVASIALGLPHAAVDGNVLRVLSRVTCETGDIGSGVVRKRLQAVADRLLDSDQPGKFNQSLMELGATVCLPRGAPECLLCPVSELCQARAAGRQHELPIKLRKIRMIRIERTVFLIENDGFFLMWQRPADSAKLAGFWELPEQEQLPVPMGELETRLLGSFHHSIVNHQYTFQVHFLRWSPQLSQPCKNVVNCAWITCNLPENMAFSTTVRKAIKLLPPAF